ncbi:hypothetical protein VitviT2T_004012 [Vitis vinifera]|uniref:DUF632 domain-containing protein n=2 Tax=Vitis vinifera TaxID=29760 RepID=A0ABY9BNR8_VITVI|nr:uncharacterized protein LOC132253475 [Vitis vinifera]WJZ84406.1 hypothetical protein VitviT2T_004012 [Vitis vinifera]
MCLPCVWVHIDFKCHSVEELGLRAETPIGTSFTDAHAGNVKFNFLNGSDPYRAYLQHRLFELRSQNQSSAQQIPSRLADSFAPESTPSAPPADNSETLMKHEPSSQFKPFRKGGEHAHGSIFEALHGWLSKFVVPEVEFCSRGRSSAPPCRADGPPLLITCHDWLFFLQKLPDETVSRAMKSLGKDIKALWIHQGEERQQKRKGDGLAKELDRRILAFQKAENRVLEFKLSEHKSEPIAQLEMGIYLSTPKTEKLSEDGENGRVRYGSSSMQGWRATMEDAHAAYPDLDASTSFFWCL